MRFVRSKYLILGSILLVALIIALAADRLSVRHYLDENEELLHAWHLELPGYVHPYYPGQTVELKEWVEDGIKPLWSVDSSESLRFIPTDGEGDPEVQAGRYLKASGFYGEDYELRQKPNGHWILFKPEKIVKRLSWTAFYRVGRGRKAEH